MISPLYFIHVWLRVDLVFASTARYLVVILCFWVVRVKKKKTRASSWFQGNVNFFQNLIFNPFYDCLWYFFKWYISHKFCKNWRYEIYFFKVKKKLQKKNTIKIDLAKTYFFGFFKCSLNFRAHALQMELNKVSILNFVKFWLQSMSFKIERAFEKTTKIFHQN